MKRLACLIVLAGLGLGTFAQSDNQKSSNLTIGSLDNLKPSEYISVGKSIIYSNTWMFR